MAFENPVLTLTEVADSDLSGSVFRFVKSTAAGGVDAAGVADVAVGVLQNKPTAGQMAIYMTEGVSRVVASAAITKGTKVAPAALGKARTAVSGDHVAGIALEAATAADQIITVKLAMGGAPLP